MRYVAFLRGMNLGGRRITNDDLCAHLEDLGFENVWAFLASGNVAFETSSRSAGAVAKKIENGLRDALGYEVPTFLRSAADVTEIAAATPFDPPTGKAGGKVQVALLEKAPSAAKRKAALACATADDALAIAGSTLFWLPTGKLTDSELDFKAIEKALGAMTVRTQRTLERLAKKLSEN